MIFNNVLLFLKKTKNIIWTEDYYNSVLDSIEPYNRPEDWLTLPTLVEGDQKFVGLFAVYSGNSNFVAFKCGGNYTVDWGDGTIENFASGAIAQRNILYESFSDQTECSRGYKQAIITITPQNGYNLTTIDLTLRHSQLAVDYANQWLDISVVGGFISSFKVSNTSNRTRILEKFNFIGENLITDFSYMFQYCYSLQMIPLIDTSSGTNFSYMFHTCNLMKTIPLIDTSKGIDFNTMLGGCYSLIVMPLLDVSKGTNFSYMIAGCASMKTTPALNTANGVNFNSMFRSSYSLHTVSLVDVSKGTDFSFMFFSCPSLKTITTSMNASNGTNFSNMFMYCYSLQTIPLIDTSSGTNFSYMFQYCYSLQTIPLIDTSKGTNFSYMFVYCYSLQTIPALNVSGSTFFEIMFSQCYSLQKSDIINTKYNISYSNCKLSANELNNIYTRLGKITGKTITVSGNWGTTSDNPSIATAKGWTVSG